MSRRTEYAVIREPKPAPGPKPSSPAKKAQDNAKLAGALAMISICVVIFTLGALMVLWSFAGPGGLRW